MKPVAEVKKAEEEVAYIPPELIRRFKRQPRKRFTEKDIDKLAESIKAIDQTEAIKVKRITGDSEHPYELVNGERRWRACTKLGRPVKAIIVSKSIKSHYDQFKASVTANFGSLEHTPMENAFAIGEFWDSEEFRNLKVMEKIKQISYIFVNRSELWIRQHFSLLKLDPKVQAMLDPDLPKEKIMNTSVAFRLAFLPPEQQVELAEKAITEKLTLRQVNVLVRKMGQGAGIVVSKRARRPSDDYRILRGFVVKVRRELDIFFDPFVLDQLKKRPRNDLEILSEDLKVCAKGIEDLAAAILAPGKSSVSERPSFQKSAKAASKTLRGKRRVLKSDSEEGDQSPPTSADLLSEEANPSNEEAPEQLDVIEPEEVEEVSQSRKLEKKGLPIVADECCLGGRDTVKACSDVLTLLGCDYGNKRKEFASREMKTLDGKESIYAEYAEDGRQLGEAPNKEPYFYGPYIVLEKFFSENSLKSDQDYLKKRQEIKDPRIRKFYPVDIGKYRKVFQKWRERYAAKKKAK